MLQNNRHTLTDSHIDALAHNTDGFSGADLRALCTDAAMGPIRQLGDQAMQVKVNDIPPISYKHFKRALKRTRPSVAPEDITQYVEWDRIYGSSSHAPKVGDSNNNNDDDDDDDDDNVDDDK
jgi:fidgetin-like protein 1